MNKRIKNLSLQIFLSFLFIFTILVSIVILYNEKYYLINKKYFIDIRNGYVITNINRFIILIVLILFLYANYIDYEYDKIENKELRADKLEIIAASLSVAGALIVIYVTLNYYKTNIPSSIENPVQ